MVPLTVLYPLYNFLIDAPMYLCRYAADQKAGKCYFGFVEGLKDAATRRVYTHEYEDWSEDMTWMVLYFFLGAAGGGILLMYAPKLEQPSSSDKDKEILTHFEVVYAPSTRQPRLSVVFKIYAVKFANQSS